MVAAFIAALAFAAVACYALVRERGYHAALRSLEQQEKTTTELSARLYELSTLSEVGKTVATSLDLNEVLDVILHSSVDLLRATEGSIMLLEDDKKHLQVVSYLGPRLETVMKGRATLGTGVSGRVAESRESMLIQGDAVPGREEQGSRHINSAMSVPLVKGDELLGVLNLSETEGMRRFNELDLATLGLFAEHAAIAIGNARLFEAEREAVLRLEDLDRQKNEFVATVSHELKTPLTAIIGAAKTVSRKGPKMDPDVHANFLAMIERQGYRLLRLVEDVLTTAHIESGGRRLKREQVDLTSTAEMVIEDLSEAKVSAGRVVRLESNPKPVRAWCDQIAMQQILVNLIDNAFKYSPEGTPVDVRLFQMDDEVLIEVTDYGFGIPAEQLEAIFKRFRQVDSSSTRKVGGFGLGLYIVKSLIDAHRGWVDVESVVDKGTTFRVHIPMRSGTERALIELGASNTSA
ncbi:MAG: two-component system, OmpR family, phosphate regulon sensor histidine kinase PhoR [Actinomycetota bacterium]|nr:two-component system, OmpR family, phosphate regulon sensor histidine kinase PhoR [Actinomycetota bacterium]